MSDKPDERHDKQASRWPRALHHQHSLGADRLHGPDHETSVASAPKNSQQLNTNHCNHNTRRGSNNKSSKHYQSPVPTTKAKQQVTDNKKPHKNGRSRHQTTSAPQLLTSPRTSSYVYDQTNTDARRRAEILRSGQARSGTPVAQYMSYPVVPVIIMPTPNTTWTAMTHNMR